MEFPYERRGTGPLVKLITRRRFEGGNARVLFAWLKKSPVDAMEKPPKDEETLLLFEPLPLAGFTLKNRLVALPVFTGYALPDGRVSSLLIEHYGLLSASGVAMVVVANTAVAPDGLTSSYNLRADRDDFIPGLTRLAGAIKKRGVLACLQLNHAGRFAKTERPLLPSALDSAHIAFNISSLREFMNFFPLEQRFRLTKEFFEHLVTWSQPMTAEDRERIIASFGDAAVRAYQAGFDIVELHGATGYLLSQFLSRYTHKALTGHDDDFQERVAFPLKVLGEVKRRLPAGFPVGFRLLLREWVPDGIDLQEAIAFAKILEREGAAYLSPSAGTYNSMFLREIKKLMSRPGYLWKDIAALTKEVRVPTILSGRIIAPRIAERLLHRGVAPLIGLGRVLRADMEWVRKAEKREKVTVCANCNTCLKRVVLNQGFNCARWPKWIQERMDLEHRLLTRNVFKGLWVVADIQDGEILKAAMPQMIAARQGISTEILFLTAQKSSHAIDAVKGELVTWSLEMRGNRGHVERDLGHHVSKTEQPLDDALCLEVERGGYGAVFLGRNQREPWRERFLYKQRGKLVGLISLNPHWSKVLIPVDLSLSTLLVLRVLSHTLLKNPAFSLDFVHVLQGKHIQAMKRWEGLRKILGWDEHFRLRLVPPDRSVAGVLLEEIAAGEYGTIVMGKRGISRIKRVLLGSVSAAVLHSLTDQSLILID